jgi:two-component system response regulator PilR (NtrC family)
MERPNARAAAAGAGVSGLSEVAPGAVLPQGVGMEGYVADIERTLLQNALDRSNGVQTKAADLLGISYRSFRHLMKKYEL